MGNAVGRRLLLLGLLLLASLAAAQAEQGPVPLTETKCYSCHGPGEWTPDMDPVLVAAPVYQALEEGDTKLALQIQNTWLTSKRDFEIRDIVATLDLSAVTGIQHRAEAPPYTPPTLEGEIVFAPEQHASNPNNLPTLPAYLQGWHRGVVTTEIPELATQWRVTLTPDNDGHPTPSDLRLLIFPGSEPNGTAPYVVDDAGPGEPEVWTAPSDAFARFGWGNWSLVAETRFIEEERVVAPTAPIPFEVTMDVGFAVDGARASTFEARPITPGKRGVVGWPIGVTGTPAGTVRGVLNVSLHYEHATSEQPDEAFASIPFEAPLLQGSNGTQWGVPGAASPRPTATGVSVSALAEAIGYLSGFLMLLSMVAGGVFGRRSRRAINGMFGSAKRRVAFHNFLSYGIILAALAHLIMFVVEINYHWLAGMLWGGLGTLCLLMLGVTGATQVPMIRRWSYATWRWWHFAFAMGALLFTIVHLLLDGVHFAPVQDALSYNDPLVPDVL